MRATAAGKADGSPFLDRPSFSDSSDFPGQPENGPGNCWDTLKMQEPSELNAWFRAGGFDRKCVVLIKSGPAKLGLAGPVRKF